MLVDVVLAEEVLVFADDMCRWRYVHAEKKNEGQSLRGFYIQSG